MSKRGPLAKAEKFYITNHVDKIDLETLAKDLDRTVNSIRKYANKVSEEQPLRLLDQFAKNGKGSVVMTENASALIDANRKTTRTNRENCVTKIKED